VEVFATDIADVFVLRPKVFRDERGFFFESYNLRALAGVGLNHQFVQDNHSHSRHNVVRGLHYQIKQPQGKLIRVVHGEIFDVAVDLRPDSDTFGRWVNRILSSENKEMLWIPPGFAHGFQVLSESADLIYKTTEYYAPQFERTIIWNDPDLKIQWPISQQPVISEKDLLGTQFRSADL
jgi:dTDP-4-dehydrorhamnose 3,5-epimerase